MSPFGIIILIVVLVVFAKGLVNPIMRPFLIFLGLVCCLLFFLLTASKHVVVASRNTQIEDKSVTHAQRIQPVDPDADVIVSTPSIEEKPAAPPKRSKIGVVAAIAQALGKAWHDHASPGSKSTPVAVAKPVVAEREVSLPRPKPPAWVNAAPKMQGDVYLMDVPVGPYTSVLECEAELPKALQMAVAEYAELSFGRDLAKEVHLSDDMLRELIRERWTETRPLDLGGTHDMVSLHVLAGFDSNMKQRIQDSAERATVTKRLQGAGVIFSGLLGLLALVWGGLRMASK